jgi:ribosomal protein L12E/L44/L45/RPP1/RPP2
MCKCVQCGKSFKTTQKFEAHVCVAALEEKSLDELMALYNAKKGN